VLVAPSAAPGTTLPQSASACISVRTAPVPLGERLSPTTRYTPRSLVLCVTKARPAPLAITTFASAACRGEWKATDFAVRFGGGDYTTFGGCTKYKREALAAMLAQAQAHGAKACLARLQSVRAWTQSARFGYGIYVVDGRC
jgi:hypothetical protein